MLTKFAKTLLVASSLSPILGAVAINKIGKLDHVGKGMELGWLWWLVAGILLVLICWGLLDNLGKTGEKYTINIAEFESTDKEMVAFLIAYLLPFIASENLEFTGQWLTGIYILVVIFLTVMHAGMVHFNPVMGLFGYHFYSYKNENGTPQVLISREETMKVGKVDGVVRLATNIYLQPKD